MKARFFAPGLIALTLIASASATAQTDNYIVSNNTGYRATESTTRHSVPAKPVASAVVEEHFAKRYPQATNAKWTNLEKGFQASFTQAGQKTTAVFSELGKFSYAITELNADNIPAEVSSYIQKQYPGHSLIQAISIRDNNKTVYQTTLQHGANCIKIKSIGEEMEVSTLQNRPSVQ